MENANRPEIICDLERVINTGRRVLIYDYSEKNLLNELCEIISQQCITDFEVWHKFEHISRYSFLRYVSPMDMEEVLKYYRLYDFSDKIIVLSDTEQHGTLFNYIRTRIITPEELAEVLLLRN